MIDQYYIVAHELHHAIEFSYGSYLTGNPGNYVFHSWMLEQTATYMENIVYPNAIHLRLLLSNCNIQTPLTHPHIGIFQSYSGALWQKFLVNYLNDDTLIRNIWETYGTQITNGEDPITFFQIFNNQIQSSSNNLFNLKSMYREYAIWRYFTGNRALSNQYFDESSLYCTSATIQAPINNVQLQSELGGSRYIQLPDSNITVDLQTNEVESIPSLIINIDNNDNITFTDLELFSGSNFIDINGQDNDENILVLLSGYNENELGFEDLNISINMYMFRYTY